jgi:uncharacterized protein
MEYHPSPLPDCRDEYPPVVPYLAERGYAVVQYDVRGTGSSSGFPPALIRLRRGKTADLVGWIAEQPWCSGAVGIIGSRTAGLCSGRSQCSGLQC